MARPRLLGTVLVAWAILSTRTVLADDRGGCSEAYQSAQRLRIGGKLRAARAELVSCARPSCTAFIRSDCTAWLGEVDAALPSIVFVALDADGQDLQGATISVDGDVIPDATDGLAHAIDPGAHDVKLEAQGHTVSMSLVARVGEKSRRVVLRIEAPPAPAPPPRPPDTRAAAPPATKRVVPAGVYVAGGIAIALAATGTTFWIVGRGAASRYNGECATVGCTSDERDNVRRELVVGDIAWAGAIVAGGVAAYLFFTRPSTLRVGFAPRAISFGAMF